MPCPCPARTWAPRAEGESAEMVNDSGQSHSPGGGGGDRAARQASCRMGPAAELRVVRLLRGDGRAPVFLLLGHLPVSGPGGLPALSRGPPPGAARGCSLCGQAPHGVRGACSRPECLPSPIGPWAWPQWTPTSPGQEGDGSVTGSRAVTPSPPFGAARPCLPRSRGPTLAPSCSGVEAGGPQGLLWAVSQEERVGLHRGAAPSRAACSLRPSAGSGQAEACLACHE